MIPLHYHDKRPVPTDWSRFHNTLPTPDEQEAWIRHYGSCNIGVALGEQSGLCMLDIDTTDEGLQLLIEKLVPPSPWRRVGQKGVMLAYRYSGLSTFRIKSLTGGMIVEMLSGRTQTVLPPSIHPTTKKPYWANCELLDVLDQLVELPSQIEAILRGALQERGIDLSHSGWTRVTDYIPAGARDVQMTRVAGHYAYGVVRGELSLVEAIGRMRAWHATSVEKVAGDDIDIEKGVQNVIKFVARDVLEKQKVLPKGWDADLSDEDKVAMGLNFSDENEEWDFNQLKEYLHTSFEQYSVDHAGRINAINFVLKKMSVATTLSVLDEERLLKYISDAAGMKMTLSSLRKQMKELARGQMRGKDHTEIAKAVISDIEQISPLRFVGGRFWTWTGSHWEVKANSEIMRLISENYGHMEMGKRHSDHNGVLKVMQALVGQEIQTAPINGVNFANGVLTEEMKLVDHDPAYGMTYTLPFRYVKEAAGKAFKFHEFLARSWDGDEDYEEKMAALQEIMCITIFGMGPKFERACLLYGVPKSGKSQLLTIASALVPDEARCACPPDSWGDKFAPTTMQGKLINICGELSEKRIIDGQKFKSVVDGEEMTGQFKGQQLFLFKPVCTHWFASNHLPRTDDTSSAFNRRWLMLQFNRPVTVEERVLNYGEQIVAEEREAIAAWAVEAMPRLLETRELTLPPSHHRLIEEVANINNSVRFFMLESGKARVVPLSGDGAKTSPHTSEMTLHVAYWSFCLGAGGAKPVGPRQFRQKMRELGSELGFRMRIVTTQSGGTECIYDGITLAGDKAA